MNHKFISMTKYIDQLESGEHGEWIIDHKSKGTLDDPIQRPWVNYDDATMDFTAAVWKFIEEHPEYELVKYHEILEKHGIKWGMDEMTAADVSQMDEQGILALVVGAVRADHFCDGALKEFIESGAVSRWLRQLKKMDEEGEEKMPKCRFELISDGITSADVQAVVNAANTGLWAGSGVCGAIFSAAGRDRLQKACSEIGHCDEGDAVITSGFNMKAEYIIHAVGPHFQKGNEQCSKVLQSAYLKALRIAKEHGIRSIVFPLIGTGAFGWPVYEGSVDAVAAIMKFMSENPHQDMLIQMAIPDAEKRKIFADVMNKAGLTTEPETDFVFFWHEDEKNGCFSQWYKLPFEIDGIEYCCCEQYMMAKKALMMGDLEYYVLIMHETDPKKIKHYGKSVRNFDPDRWDKNKQKIIHDCNLAKFSQNYRYGRKLIDTGDAILAEASPYDKIYGIGMKASDPDAKDPGKWKGENILGKALMKVREELR